jgi:hypothetical protein
MVVSICITALGADDSARGLEVRGQFSGSSNAYGQVYRFDPLLDYRFSRHFSIDGGAPLYFVRLSDTLGTSKNTGNGVGDIYTTLKLDAYHRVVDVSSSLRLSAPTGDREKGLSARRMTADWDNMLHRSFGRVMPFANLGLANTITDTPFFVRPFMSLGPVAHLEGAPCFP